MIGQSIPRKESLDKVTGAAKYTNDFAVSGLLHAWLLTSTHAHARIASIDISGAFRIPGVLAVVTGEDINILTGPFLEDRPPLARGKVRYYGEPVAVVVAHSEQDAMLATEAIHVEYEPLPVVNSIDCALADNPTLVHEWLGLYSRETPDACPEPSTNIADRVKIRKGDMTQGWSESDVVVEASYDLPQSSHGAMETRVAQAQVLPDGQVIIYCSTQGPFIIKKMISKHFNIPIGKVTVNTPLVGGAFGGKTPVQMEYITLLASKAVGGRPVRLVYSREQDFHTGAQHCGFKACIKLGANRHGELKAAELLYMVECGAYTDSTPDICRAVAANGPGPYRIDNVWCDTLCVYTNHPFTTAFRGFGHLEYATVIERTMDKLAFRLGMDPVQLRMKNALVPGDTSPTRVRLTPDRLGDLPQCIVRLRNMMQWDQGTRAVVENGHVRAKGIGCFWKTSSSPTDAISGAVIILNEDGSVNLMVGVVEIGPGSKTVLAQICAERMKLDVDQIHVRMDVNTSVDPYHWKTVASKSTYMAGRAVLHAADEVIRSLRGIAAIALHCSPEDLEVANGRVYLKADPALYLDFKELAHGYKYANGNAIGGQIIGHGNFIMTRLTPLDPETGKGNSGPGWTVGAQGVEVELEPATWTYRILRAYTVIDVGKILNPKTARGVIMGGMCMGLGYGCREKLEFDGSGMLVNTQFRTYHLMRFGEQPEYEVDFVEAPDVDAPYGMRGIGEHGILAVPGALLNALSSAAQVDLRSLPITPESIWRARKEASL